MSKAIDAIRDHFNQEPIPKAKCLLDERARVNAMIDTIEAENAELQKLARWASRLLTGIMPYVDYSRCTALEAVAAWKVEASNLGIEANE